MGIYREGWLLSPEWPTKSIAPFAFSSNRHIKDPTRESSRDDHTISAGSAGKGESKVKPIKMLGLAAFAALMAMALLGASSAMAESTQLCKADESPCAAGNVVSHVHELTLTGAPSTLLTSLGTITLFDLFLGDSLG
jgi:hypothetical protein